jgi:hypothetical protein
MYLDPAQFKTVLENKNRRFEKLIRDLKLADPACIAAAMLFWRRPAITTNIGETRHAELRRD